MESIIFWVVAGLLTAVFDHVMRSRYDEKYPLHWAIYILVPLAGVYYLYKLWREKKKSV
jgi:uncharacterized membrane protein YuzA (DUF378 family)